MAIDLRSGMDASSDYFLAERPADADFRESASMWVFDDVGAIGLPRVGIEAVAGSWETRGLQVNLGFPDGRSAIVREAGEGRSPVDHDGVCRTFAAGGLVFRCVEPFKTITMTYEGTVFDTTAAALAKGEPEGARIPLQVEVEMSCAAPPWVPGTLNEAAAEVFHQGFAGAYISPRYEQLCTSRAARFISVTRSGRSPAPACASTAREPTTPGAFGATARPARYSRAVGDLAGWPSPSGATGSPPTTRRTCSTASA